MPKNKILKIGDTVQHSVEQKGRIEKIRIISSGKFVPEFEYDKKAAGEDIVLTLRHEYSVLNLWLKNTPVYKIIER
jgi:hypothetical protein